MVRYESIVGWMDEIQRAFKDSRRNAVNASESFQVRDEEHRRDRPFCFA
jgi:hypothetical protein